MSRVAECPVRRAPSRLSRHVARRVARLVAVLLALLLGPAIAPAAVITVNDFADYDFDAPPSNVNADDPTLCTLRKAIANANANSQVFNDCPAGSGADEIRFAGGGTVVLGNLGSPLFVNGDLTLRGPATIDGSNEGDILRVTNGGVDLVIEQMTLRRGSNGAITIFTNTGSLRVNQSRFESNSEDANGGGAIDSASPIQLEAVEFTANAYTGNLDGGGAIRLSSSDPSSITNSFFLGNLSETSGGAIWFSNAGTFATLTITNTLFQNNVARAAGGAGEGGGAIFHQNGLLTLLDSTFNANLMTGDDGRGGALHLAIGSPVAVLDHNLFTFNQASGDAALGGAIYSGRSAVVRASAFVGNTAGNNGLGGAVANSAVLKSDDFAEPGFVLANCTLTDNRASRGGAIYNQGGDPGTGGAQRGLTLLNVTVDSNVASEPAGGGGIYNAFGLTAPEADLRNTILANNQGGGGDDNCNGDNPVLNFHGNLLWPGGTCDAIDDASQPAPILAGDPKLAGASVNPPDVLTLSMKPQAGSAALEVGANETCTGFAVFGLDQRSLLAPIRPDPAGTACDAGAYESGLRPPAPALDVLPNTGLLFGTVALGATPELVATVTNPGGVGLTGLALAVSGTAFSLQATSCGATLGPGASCTAAVRFAPGLAQPEAGVLAVTADAGLADQIPLAGTGFVPAPGLALAPGGGLAFGDQPTGTTSASLTATVSNTGNVDLTGLASAASGPFAVVAGGTCGAVLTQGSSCTVEVAFSPLVDGTAGGGLTATADGGLSASILLSGFGTSPALLDLSPDPPGGVDFGAVEVGTGSDLMVATLTNLGTATATGVVVMFLSSPGPFSLEDTTCGATLPGGASCSLEFRFAPLAAGPFLATFGALADGPLNDVVPLQGMGFVAPALTVTPAVGLDFGAVPTGSTSPALSATVANPGGATLTGLVVAPSAGFEVVATLCTSTLDPGDSCTVDVAFSPSGDGPVAGALGATADGGLADQIPLAGSGFTPGDLVLAPSALHLGSVPVGSTSAGAQAILLNPGSVTVTGLGLAASGDFAVAATTCGATLAGGASCAVVVELTPTGAGPRVGSLTAVGSAGGAVSDAIPLGGDGFVPTGNLDLGPDAGLDFGAVAAGAVAGPLAASLTNLGAGSVGGIAVAASGDFAVVPGGTCGATLGAGASCTVQVELVAGAPGLVVGSLMATGSGGQLDQIGLRAMALDPSEPGFGSTPTVPGPIDFGPQAIGLTVARTLAIAELGGADLLVGAPALLGDHAGDFAIVTPLPMLIPDGAAPQELALTCTPTAVGERTATLSLQTNDPAQPQVDFALRCEGSAAEGEQELTLSSATGSGPVTVAVVGGGAPCGFSGLTSLLGPPPGAPPLPPTTPPGDPDFPHGLLLFELTSCTPAATLEIVVTYPQPLPTGTVFWRYGPTPGDPLPHWHVQPATIVGASVAFQIADGGLGDDDLTVDGVILGLGGPGVPAAAVEIPSLDHWGLLLLVTLLAALGARHPVLQGLRDRVR